MTTTVILVIQMLVGLVCCFRGQKYLRLFMVLYGFYAGYNLIMSLYGNIGGYMWVLAVGVGIVVALFAFLVEKFAFFLAGGFLGLVVYAVVYTVNPLIFAGQTQTMAIVFFVVGGIITLLARRQLLIIGTASYGAYSFTLALGELLGVIGMQGTPSPIQLLEQTSGRGGLNVFDNLSPVSMQSVFTTLPSFVPWIIIIVLAFFGMRSQFKKSD